MTDQVKASKSSQAINVGVYGCTKAGKTRFLFQLLNRWERTRRLLGLSETCQKFLATVESEIEKHSGSMPTVATTEGIKVKVRRDGSEPPVELIFRDLRGELLSEELDQLASLSRTDVIPAQVRQCNAFLFFFDPASSENPTDIDKHHARELKRATMFIEYVLKVRENRYLPIIFVQTHLDQWGDDPDIRAKSERWFADVHTKLVELYDSGLHRFHPKSIVDRSRTAFSVSSVGNTPEAERQLEKVIEQLNDLVVDATTYRQQVRKTGLYTLVAGTVALALLVFVAWLLSSMGGSPTQPKKDDTRIAVAEMPEQDIIVKLQELDRILKSHPRGTQLPSVEEARKLNHHLRWLAQRLEPDSGGMTGLSEKTQQRMRSALDSVARTVNERAESKGISPVLPTLVLAAYLEDLPDLTPSSAALATAQGRYWQILRDQVVEQLADILKRRHEVASPPVDALGEVVSKLRGLEQEVGRCKVFGPKARQDLVQEVQIVATFCEDRKNSKTYSATFRVASASYASDKKVDLAWRSITLQSPGLPSVDYGLEPNRKNDNELSFNTKRSDYQIALGLGTPIISGLSVHDSTEGKWRKVQDFDLTTEQGPLTPLGLPLLNIDQAKVTKHLQRDGMELRLEFSGLPRVPPLLWDAAVRARERKP